MTDPVLALLDRWRDDAETLRRYGAEPAAAALDARADEVEAALDARRLASVTIEEATEIGGYSYSHLQHLVADGTIENVGAPGSPRIRREDVPRKPGAAGRAPHSRSEALDRSLRLHRETGS